MAEVEEVETATRYICRRNPFRAEDIRRHREEKMRAVFDRILQKNMYLEEHPRASVDVALRHIADFVKKVKLEAFVTYKAIDRTIECRIDEEALEESTQLDGCYVIKTDLPKTAANAQVIHDRYKDLGTVEWAFRTFKTGYEEIRPIFVRKENRTRAHVFICMLAYLILKYAWDQVKPLGYTRDFIFSTLDKIQYVKYTYGSALIKRLPSRLQEHQQEILDRLKITLPRTL